MSQQTITVTFIGPGVFTWTASNDGGQVANGTGTSVQNAGAQAVTAIKAFISNQVTGLQGQSTGWQ